VSELRAVTDRVEIAALCAEYNDAGMMADHDRFAALFTQDAVLRWPHIDAEFVGRAEIRATIERLRGNWEFFVQNTHPGVLRLDGDTATGRVYVHEFGRLRDGGSHLNHSTYHDRYRRTPDGWKFAERVYEVRYVDTTPLPGTGAAR
jgi:ketosteroid isomerase-like protein